jgi:hypothetical protein
MSWLSSIIGGLTGSSAAKAANQQTQLAKDANAFTQQQWNQVGLPTAQIQLQNLQKMQPLQNQMLGWLSGGTAGGMTGGSTSGQPWWMNVQQPGAEINNALSTLSKMNLNKAAQGEANNMAAYNASRGVNISSEQATRLPGFNRAMLPMRAQETANRALTLDQMQAQRRGEAGNNYWNMANWLTGQPAYQNPNATVMPWASMYQGMGANAQNAAAQYGAQSANSLGSLGSLIGMYLGNRNQQQPTTAQGLSALGNGANISALLPFLIGR